MADIAPVETMLPMTSEYKPINQTFTPILGDEKLISISITSWDKNDGITVIGSRYSGEYTNTFDYGKDRLLYRKGDEFSYLESWDDIVEPHLTDIYLWRAPTQPRTYRYTVIMKYETKGETSRSSMGGGIQTITKTYTQLVYPNYDTYAKKLRDQIEIRRKTWLE